MYTSRLQYIDRGARGLGDMPSECSTKAYMQGDIAYVPTFKRLCVKAYTGKNDNDVLEFKDIGNLATWIASSLGTNGVSYGMVNQLAKVLVGDGTKKIGDIPVHDPSINTKEPDKPPVYDPPGNDPIYDGLQTGGDVLTKAIDAIKFLTEPASWLAMLSIVIGFGLLGFALFKGISTNA